MAHWKTIKNVLRGNLYERTFSIQRLSAIKILFCTSKKCWVFFFLIPEWFCFPWIFDELSGIQVWNFLQSSRVFSLTWLKNFVNFLGWIFFREWSPRFYTKGGKRKFYCGPTPFRSPIFILQSGYTRSIHQNKFELWIDPKKLFKKLFVLIFLLKQYVLFYSLKCPFLRIDLFSDHSTFWINLDD